MNPLNCFFFTRHRVQRILFIFFTFVINVISIAYTKQNVTLCTFTLIVYYAISTVNSRYILNTLEKKDELI